MSLPSIFVFGIYPESSGKTTVCLAIVRGLMLRGWDVGVFKPRSGHSYWYHHDIYVKCSAEGRLFSWDILKLSKAQGGEVLPLEVLNPVDALFSPPDSLSLDEHSFLVRRSNLFFEMVAERYTIVDGVVQNILCVNQFNFESDNLLFKEWNYVKRLKEKADKIVPIETLEEWNEVYLYYAPIAIKSCYEKVSSQHEAVIVEGFSDAVCPNPDLSFDTALGVLPGAIFCYDGKRFKRAIEVVAGTTRDPTSLEARDIINLLRPNATVRVPAISSQDAENHDRLALKLNSIVDLAEKILEKQD